LLLAVQMFLCWFQSKYLTRVCGTGRQNSACNCTICYAVRRLGEGMALVKKITAFYLCCRRRKFRNTKLQDIDVFVAELLS